jgi:hypothetical protein
MMDYRIWTDHQFALPEGFELRTGTKPDTANIISVSYPDGDHHVSLMADGLNQSSIDQSVGRIRREMDRPVCAEGNDHG